MAAAVEVLVAAFANAPGQFVGFFWRRLDLTASTGCFQMLKLLPGIYSALNSCCPGCTTHSTFDHWLQVVEALSHTIEWHPESC